MIPTVVGSFLHSDNLVMWQLPFDPSVLPLRMTHWLICVFFLNWRGVSELQTRNGDTGSSYNTRGKIRNSCRFVALFRPNVIATLLSHHSSSSYKYGEKIVSLPNTFLTSLDLMLIYCSIRSIAADVMSSTDMTQHWHENYCPLI